MGDSKIITLGNRVPKSRRNQVAQEAALDQRHPTVEEVRTWITAGSLAAGKKVYDELAAEHGRVFELQGQAMQACLDELARRISDDAPPSLMNEMERLGNETLQEMAPK